MSLKVKFAIPREIRRLWRREAKQAEGFFAPVLRAAAQGVPLAAEGEKARPLAWSLRHAQAGVEQSLLADGKIQVTYTTVWDDDKNFANGALLQKDRFVLNASGQGFDNYYREFHFNKMGREADFWGRAEAYFTAQAFCATDGLVVNCPSPQKTKELYPRLGRAAPRSLTPAILQLGGYASFLSRVQQALTARGYGVAWEDGRNYYRVDRDDLMTTLSFATVVQTQGAKDPKWFLRKDHFTFLNSELLGDHLEGPKLLSYQVTWEQEARGAKPGLEQQQWQSELEKLKTEIPAPSLIEAQALAQIYLQKGIVYFVPGKTGSPRHDEGENKAKPTADRMSPDAWDELYDSVLQAQALRSGYDYDPTLFAGLSQAQNYLAPLQEILGPEIKLTLGPDVLRLGQRRRGEQTELILRYQPRSSQWAYTEILVFFGSDLIHIHRHFTVVRFPADAKTLAWVQAKQAALPTAALPGLTDPRLVAWLEILRPYLAPQLVVDPGARRDFLEKLSIEGRILEAAVTELQLRLLELQQPQGIDLPDFKALIGALQAWRHGSWEEAQMILANVAQNLRRALSFLTAEKRGLHEDWLHLVEASQNLIQGDLRSSQLNALQIQSAALREILLQTLNAWEQRFQLLDLLSILQNSELVTEQAGAGFFQQALLFLSTEGAAQCAPAGLLACLHALPRLNPEEESLRQKFLQDTRVARLATAFRGEANSLLRRRDQIVLVRDFLAEGEVKMAAVLVDYLRQDPLLNSSAPETYPEGEISLRQQLREELEALGLPRLSK